MTAQDGRDAYGRARVWTYRTPALYARDEAEARMLIEHEALRTVPNAAVRILSIRRTPTGRYSAMVRREREA